MHPHAACGALYMVWKRTTRHKGSRSHASFPTCPLFPAKRVVVCSHRGDATIVSRVHQQSVIPHSLFFECSCDAAHLHICCPKHARVVVHFALTVPTGNWIVRVMHCLPWQVHEHWGRWVMFLNCGHSGVAIECSAVSIIIERLIVLPALVRCVALLAYEKTDVIIKTQIGRQVGHRFVARVTLTVPVVRVPSLLQLLRNHGPSQIEIISNVATQHFTMVHREAA